MVRNTYIYPPEPSMRIIGDIFAYVSAVCNYITSTLYLLFLIGNINFAAKPLF